jgi:hypothetical protein
MIKVGEFLVSSFKTKEATKSCFKATIRNIAELKCLVVVILPFE